MSSIISLPGAFRRRIDAAANALLNPQNNRQFDFTKPFAEEALVGADSVSWRIFKNPVALFVGGMAAVILELAEPAVRTGVWEHSSFLKHPLGRLQRTGLAAMVTIYGARSVAEPMIARVARLHARIEGETPAGERYSANDSRLLGWVHVTAAYCFAEAYSRFVEPLRPADFDAVYREGAAASRLYGAVDPPTSALAVETFFASMRGRLEPSSIVFQFLHIMRETAALPGALRWIQPMLVRAAVEMTPGWIRERLGLDARYGLRARENFIVRMAGDLADRIALLDGPAAQSCRRLGLSPTYLYR